MQVRASTSRSPAMGIVAFQQKMRAFRTRYRLIRDSNLIVMTLEDGSGPSDTMRSTQGLQ